MTILHYIPSIDETSGGVGAYMQLLTRDLGALCELHVVTHRSENERKLEGCHVHYISQKWMPWTTARREFLDILAVVKPDVVHVNCCWSPMCSLVTFWAKGQGLKVVYTPHGMLEPWIMKRHYWTRKLPAILLYQRRAIRMADMLHATAESEQQHLLALGWNKQIGVIGNCINVDDIQLKSDWHSRQTILFLSRVHVKKGINFLIEAVAAIKEELAGYVVKIAGPGDAAYIEELKNLAKSLGVDEQVKFVGSVFGEAKFELYREADLFVLPTHSENFGIVVTEALACGTPVMTTKGTPWQELETCHCGWWTEIGTEPTVKALKDFLTMDDKQLERMGRNGRKLVEEHYSSRKIAGEFMELYCQLAHRRCSVPLHQ